VARCSAAALNAPVGRPRSNRIPPRVDGPIAHVRRSTVDQVHAEIPRGDAAGVGGAAGPFLGWSRGAVPSAEEVARSPFLAALMDLGWIMGQNIAFEPRHAAGQPDRLPLAFRWLDLLWSGPYIGRADSLTGPAVYAVLSNWSLNTSSWASR
jgi:hypothetical protein